MSGPKSGCTAVKKDRSGICNEVFAEGLKTWDVPWFHEIVHAETKK